VKRQGVLFSIVADLNGKSIQGAKEGKFLLELRKSAEQALWVAENTESSLGA